MSLKLAGKGNFGVVASGITYSVAMDIISELGLDSRVGLYKVSQIFPLLLRYYNLPGNRKRFWFWKKPTQCWRPC